MKAEHGGFVPITEVPPTDLFVCTYGGKFAQHLELNVPVVEGCLNVASLDGRVLLQESKARRSQPIPDGINPDGSVAGRGSLRWGQKIEAPDKKQNPYFQVESDEAGWIISINGDLITEDLMKKNGRFVREIEDKFTNKFNYYLSVSLREALLKDKCTDLKDHSIKSRVFTSGLILANIVSFPTLNWIVTGLLGFQVSQLIAYNLLDRYRTGYPGKNPEGDMDKIGTIFDILIGNKLPILNYFRRTVESPLDCLGFPFEIDRLALAYGYLDFNKYIGRNPLVRVAN